MQSPPTPARSREGRPIVRRFVIRRNRPTPTPWTIRDRSRPSWLGHAATVGVALRRVDDIVRTERGLAPRIVWDEVEA